MIEDKSRLSLGKERLGNLVIIKAKHWRENRRERVRSPNCYLFNTKVVMHLTCKLLSLLGVAVLPACSLGGDLLKLSLSVGQSDVELLGAGNDSFSVRKKTRFEKERRSLTS